MPKKQVTVADIRRALVNCKEAHEQMINKTEYDRAFHYGLVHAICIIDQLLQDAWRAAVQESEIKTNNVKLKRRRNNDI